jgi:hypothetical protein
MSWKVFKLNNTPSTDLDRYLFSARSSLPMKVSSRSIIPAFRRYVTV